LKAALEAELKPWILVKRLPVEPFEGVRVEAHPSLFSDLARLAFELAQKGYRARVTAVWVWSLLPAKLLPPALLKPLRSKLARVVLEVAPVQR